MADRGKRVRVLVALGGVGAALAFAPAASAAKFCVLDPACASSGGTAQATLQAAFNAANANGAGLDQVEIGAVTLPAGGNAGSAVEVIGEGQGQTLVDGSGGGTIVTLTNSGSSIRDLSIRIDGDDGRGLFSSAPVTRVTIAGASTALELGASLFGGATSRELTILLPTNTTNRALDLSSAGIEDSRIVGEIAVFAGGSDIAMRRVRVVGGSQGISLGPSTGGQLTIDDATVQTTQPGGTALAVLGPTLIGAPATMVARNVTAVGSGSGTGARSAAACPLMFGMSPTQLTLRSVILRGFGTDLARSGQTGCGSPAGSIDVADSIYDPAKITESGPGVLTQGAGNLNADPLFADQAGGNFLLTPGSPAIDAGDPAALTAGESTTDVAGSPRVTDGDGDGTARRDIGAFEAPTVVLPLDIDRTLKLGYARSKQLFKGKLKSPEPDCRKGEVTVFRKKGGPDKKVGSDATNAKGKWKFDRRAKPGKYYATVNAEPVTAGTCVAAKSKTKKLH